MKCVSAFSQHWITHFSGAIRRNDRPTVFCHGRIMIKEYEDKHTNGRIH